jgi:hypothetical protein
MCFGIPFDDGVFPMRNETDFDHGNHFKWLNQRRMDEEKTTVTTKKPPAEELCHSLEETSQHEQKEGFRPGDIVTVPSPIDILLGRSKICQSHVGNARYLHFIGAHIEEYEATAKQKKTKLADEYIETIKNAGSRFLKETERGWEVVDDKTARGKLANAFRDKRKKSKAKEDQPSVVSKNTIISTKKNTMSRPTQMYSPAINLQDDSTQVSAEDHDIASVASSIASNRNASTKRQRGPAAIKEEKKTNDPLLEELDVKLSDTSFSQHEWHLPFNDENDIVDDLSDEELLFGDISANVDWELLPPRGEDADLAYISE